ncbi:MAG TPA: hypothetical protein PLU35_07055, partial [Phycisphaerales bacterium]|nr:hypothetical protein [Phycisphaerales bacterium]
MRIRRTQLTIRGIETRRARAIACSLAAACPVLLATLAPSARAQNLFFCSNGFNGSRDALYTTDLDGLGLTNIMPSPMGISGVAADGGQRLVFWKNHLGTYKNGNYTYEMHVADFSGGSHAVIASWSGSSNNYGVAVDRVNQHVYWTDAAGVQRSNYDGTGAAQVIASFNAEDVEIDPVAGKIFWVDSWGGPSVNIYAANLNGSGQQTLVTLSGNTVVSGLTVDPGTQTVFWSNYVAGTVSAIPYAGGTPSTILGGYPWVAGLEYEATTNRLYIVNKGSASVAWMNPSGGPLTTVFTGSGQTLGEMWDIAAVVPAPGSLAL